MLDRKKWTTVLILGLLVWHSSVVLAEEDDEHVAELEQEEVQAETKEKFVPSLFVSPVLGENSAEPYLFDYFPKGSKIGDKWVKSTAKKEGTDENIAKYNGEWDIGTPSKVAIEGDLGLIVKTKARHHAITAKLDRPFTFDSKSLVVQYDVKFEEGQECGGGYLKLLSEGAEKELADVQDKTPYTIMFGPDKCGATGKVHLIFRYKNPKNGSIDEYHAKQPSAVGTTYWDDHKTHLYTLVVKPTGEYSVSVDGKNLFYGNMLNDVTPSLTPPKQIFDPSDMKPVDWDDRAEIEDETATKPDDWDENEPKEVVDESATKPSDWHEDENDLIPDPDATKPADWDDDMDGDWEPPMIDNPACKGLSGCGQWKPPTISNPKYKGKWVRPKIANPAFKGTWSANLIENPNFFEPKPFVGLAPITAVGIELWTMSENIIFDDILVTSSEEDAADLARQTFYVKQSDEYRLGKANGDNNSFLNSIMDAAEERPWLWIVYVLCVVLPIILLGVLCFGRQSKPAPTNYAHKKSDSLSADDRRVPNLVDDAEVSEEADEDENMPGPSGINRDEPVVDEDEEKSQNGSTASSAAEEEDEEELVIEENEPVQPTEEVAHSKSPKTGPKRRTARRGD